MRPSRDAEIETIELCVADDAFGRAEDLDTWARVEAC